MTMKYQVMVWDTLLVCVLITGITFDLSQCKTKTCSFSISSLCFCCSSCSFSSYSFCNFSESSCSALALASREDSTWTESTVKVRSEFCWLVKQLEKTQMQQMCRNAAVIRSGVKMLGTAEYMYYLCSTTVHCFILWNCATSFGVWLI